MKSWLCGLVGVGLILLQVTGCATIISKAEMDQFGQPFSGVKLDAGVALCLGEAAISSETQPPYLGNISSKINSRPNSAVLRDEHAQTDTTSTDAQQSAVSKGPGG